MASNDSVSRYIRLVRIRIFACIRFNTNNKFDCLHVRVRDSYNHKHISSHEERTRNSESENDRISARILCKNEIANEVDIESFVWLAQQRSLSHSQITCSSQLSWMSKALMTNRQKRNWNEMNACAKVVICICLYFFHLSFAAFRRSSFAYATATVKTHLFELKWKKLY